MGSKFRRLPSPSMAVAFVALLAALTGTAVALPGTNTVDSRDIINSQVKTQDIRNSTVRGKDVRNNTLTGADVRESTLGKVPSAARADTAGSAGSANTANSANSANTVGANGVSSGAIQNGAVTGGKLGQVVQHFSDVTVPAGGSAGTNAGCAAGEKLIGGGAQAAEFAVDSTLVSSRPFNEVDGEEVTQWRGAAFNNTGSPQRLRVFAVCLK